MDPPNQRTRYTKHFRERLIGVQGPQSVFVVLECCLSEVILTSHHDTNNIAR